MSLALPREDFFLLATLGPGGGMKTWSATGTRFGLRVGASCAIVGPAAPDETISRFAHSPMIEESAQQAADRQLLAEVARGEQAAFSALYDRLGGPLYSLCLRMTGEAQEAEDILQEVCVTIWRRAATYDPARSSVFSWAVHLTRCKTIDHLRSRGRRLRVLVSPAGNRSGEMDAEPGAQQNGTLLPATSGLTAADELERNEQADRVRRALDTLPAEQSQVISLAFFGDLSHHEISARLDQPLGTVKARIRRGLLKLRDGLRGGA